MKMRTTAKPRVFPITVIRILPVLLLLISFLLPESLHPVQAQTGTPQLILTKSVEGSVTSANVGDIIRYRIRFECSSLEEACGVMEITDILPNGLIYLPPPYSSVPAGFTISESSGTVSITKDDDNLLDGSQYDAVIAVRVDYDLRPLPATITNTVTGWIDPPFQSVTNATPASAPSITINQITTPQWELTKSLFSPSVNPTLDTDVTYRIRLCPTTESGNLPLQDVVVTDTLPTGSVYVSSSDSGSYDSGAGVVTWPTVTGPVYPPSCVTRYVTIQYPSASFTIGDDVTNSASANGSYVDNDNELVPPADIDTTPIDHPIDPISETPSYSKDDTGDPVSLTGTARFILNLNTNNTNYPSRDAILIDNLPSQLQVFSVTSGGWDESFAFVRAYVEYSTDFGASYTAFSGNPVEYDSNTEWTAPVDNITNIRWRFEYDPDTVEPYDFTDAGLPYSWSFTTQPQIRVTPRQTAATADDSESTVLPAAIAGDTYTNCLQVSRTNSSNTPVLDACNNENITVSDPTASLRTYKNETPGTGWDDLDDPNITTFTADETILPGDTVRYVITVELTERSSANLVNPTIQDIMPASMIFVRNGTATLDGVALPDPQQPVFSQSGQTLTWSWNTPAPVLDVAPLELGSRYLRVEFFARVPRGQGAGSYTNDSFTLTDSDSTYCETGTPQVDTDDLDGDGITTELICVAPDTYVVERSAALRGEKWVRSTSEVNAEVVSSTTFQPDATCPDGGTVGLATGGSNNFTRFPCIAQAYPENAISPGEFVQGTTDPLLDDYEYNLRVFNDGNVPMLEYVLYDILPYVGDTGSGGTLASSQRTSEFRPLLRDPVEFISGPDGVTADSFTIEYSNSTNPCRPEVFNEAVGAAIPAGCTNDWSATFSTNARAYRIRLVEGAEIPSTASSADVRFGVPMYIPSDAPVVGTFDMNDAQTKEIAWNSFAHVGSYDKDPETPVVIQDLLASEPRKVGITVPEVMSVGNRVWRDSDNSGTINAPDDSTPGIEGVAVNLYRDTNDDGVADGAAIASTTTNELGYYLFSNIPYDSDVAGNNRYIIGIPASNFTMGQPLYQLRSSSGTPPSTTYTNPASANGDNTDNGIDPISPMDEVFSASFVLQPETEPTAETDLSGDPAHGPVGRSRGLNAEMDYSSDLTIDFGFFGGMDIPFSIGNLVWKDNGAGGGTINNGIRESGEPPVTGLDVVLYRDGNNNGVLTADEIIRSDITDANGYYLFDNLDPGNYYVRIPASEFTSGQPLAGWFSSGPTGTEDVGVAGNPNTPSMDLDDNGVNSYHPETDGVTSSVIVLVRGTDETTGETDLSGEADPGSPANTGYNPTGWDGEGSIGRFGELDTTSNVTIDFGFIPPMSLGNRVWFDSGNGTTPYRAGYNNGIMDGIETGAANVSVQIYEDTNASGTFNTGDTLLFTTTTNSTGYYLFDRLQPGNYFVRVAPGSFASGQPLNGYISSYDARQATSPADDQEDKDDNGIDNAAPATNGTLSPMITLAYTTEPITGSVETDINVSGTYGPNNVGNFGQLDTDSDLTVDFGFVRPPRSVGNFVWYDDNNNGIRDGMELPVGDVRVNLYLDANSNNVPDDINVIGDTSDDWVGYDITDAQGYYLFDNLPPANYIIGIDLNNFDTAGDPLYGYTSSTVNVNNQTNNLDTRDNGRDTVNATYGVLADRINLSSGAPTGESALSSATGVTLGNNPTAADGPTSRGRYGEADNASDLTIDFGFFIPLSLGNRVWVDNGLSGGGFNNGLLDGGETGLAGIVVGLYRDSNDDGITDTPTPFRTYTTDANGYYRFDLLGTDTYIVEVTTPAGYHSSTVDAGDPDNNLDSDDNGILVGVTTTVRSMPVSLAPTTEPISDNEPMPNPSTGEALNENSNRTVDFGFYPLFSVGNRVWFDVNNDGQIDGSEVGASGVTVQIFDQSNNEVLVGPDGVLGTVDDTTGGMLTNAAGYYRFDGLLPGQYMIVLPSSNFDSGHPLNGTWSSGTSLADDGTISESAADLADSDTDSNDNGTKQPVGSVIASMVTLGPTITAEPTAEGDIASGSAAWPDGQQNLAVDFGFYTMQLGDQVWIDMDNNGRLDGGEVGVPGVTVELWSPASASALATTTTNAGGIYQFANLPAGNYFVRLPAGNFNPGGILRDYRSSTGSSTEPGPNPDADTTNSDDNGTETGALLGLGGYIQSSTFALTPGAEDSINAATGLTLEPRIDFGVQNSPQIDLSIDKSNTSDFYIAGGTVNYTIVVTNLGPADANGATVADTLPAQLTGWTWTCDAATPAAYNCSGGTGAPFSDQIDLPQLASLTYQVTATVAADATGTLTNTATVSAPLTMTDLNPSDNSDSETDDIASVAIIKDDHVTILAPNATTSYEVIITNTGQVDLVDLVLTDTLPADMTFVSASSGGSDTPPTTISGNVLTWDHTALSGLSLIAPGDSLTITIVAKVNATPAATSLQNQVQVVETTHAVSAQDDDIDQIATSYAKSLTGTSEAGSGSATPVNPEPVFIGEILTYQIRMGVPVGQLLNLKANDVLDSGLAFVRCVSIDGGDTSTDVTGGYDQICGNPTVSAYPSGSPATVDQGRQFQLDFGTVSSESADTIVVTYEVVVLDTVGNVGGTTGLNNHVDWTWNTDSILSGEAGPVSITEPQLVVVKTAQPTTAALGSIITFTLDISHASSSSAPAYDVILTDQLPTGLGFVAGSISSTGLAPDSFSYDDATATLTFNWGVYPLGQTSRITFQATFIGPSPVQNQANLEWTSLEIDPGPGGQPVQRSPYNTLSTERWYDPAATTLNNYYSSSDVQIVIPRLPDTGFAPDQVTNIPAQPAEMQYTAVDDIRLEIPALGLDLVVTGVPVVNGEYDLTWLGNQVGYLEGTAFPTHAGNSVITGHVYLPDGNPGPFVDLTNLKFGDQIIIHAYGQKYIYQVNGTRQVSPDDHDAITSEEYPVLTLITCQGYNEESNAYQWRYMVSAVQIKVEDE